MWIYERKLQYPVKIKNPNPALAKIIISQLGGPDGELAASTRYLCQRFSMPYREVSGILTDVGTCRAVYPLHFYIPLDYPAKKVYNKIRYDIIPRKGM
ncbi:MAG: manganese catalase family protein [Clostridia bacterium]|nr:manganese catalase family protein [Clostridia bacterium]